MVHWSRKALGTIAVATSGWCVFSEIINPCILALILITILYFNTKKIKDNTAQTLKGSIPQPHICIRFLLLSFFLFLFSSPLISLLVDWSLINNNTQDARLTRAIKHTRVNPYKRQCLCTAVSCPLLHLFYS